MIRTFSYYVFISWNATFILISFRLRLFCICRQQKKYYSFCHFVRTCCYQVPIYIIFCVWLGSKSSLLVSTLSSFFLYAICFSNFLILWSFFSWYFMYLLSSFLFMYWGKTSCLGCFEFLFELEKLKLSFPIIVFFETDI